MILQSKITKAILNQPFSKVDLDLGGVEFEIPLEVEPAPREYFQNAIGKRPSKPLLDRNAIRILENYDTMESTVTLHGGILKLSSDLCIAHTGGEPCYEVEEIVTKALENIKVIFSGYSDAIAYIPTDKLIPEGGYEVDSFLEYGNKVALLKSESIKSIRRLQQRKKKLFG